jgi:hypothetical protein
MVLTDGAAPPVPETLVVLTEAELASLRAEEGARVVERHGRFWTQTFPGFFQPVHQLAEHRLTDVRRPVVRCWGYRSALVAEDAAQANGSLPVHLLADLPRFTEAAFDESRRRDLRKCRRQVEVVRMRDPDLFLRDGWSVYDSANRRVPLGPTMSEPEFRREMGQRVGDPRRVFVAGLIDGKLAGYLESYAVDGIFYGHELYVTTEALPTGIGTGLYLETMQIGVRAGTVHALCLGPVLRERPGVTKFKLGLGVPEALVPARVQIPRPIRAVIKTYRPAVYYRLTGDADPLSQRAQKDELQQRQVS